MASYIKQSNKWTVRFRHNGIQKRIGGLSSKKEAEIAFAEYVNANPIITLADNMKFSELTKHYLENQVSKIKESSVYATKRKIYLHLIPYFGQKEVISIKPFDILKWQQSLDKYAYKTKTGLRQQLSAILKFGSMYFNLPNIIDKVERFSRKASEIRRKEMTIWSTDQFNQFIGNVSDDTEKLLFYALYCTGMRKGEALALSPNDIDTTSNMINVDKSITRKVQGSPWKVTTPKNAYSIRKIIIPQALSEMFKNAQISGDFVFGGTRPLADRTIDRTKAKAIKDANLPYCRTHDFRHSHASYLLSQGLNVVAVSKRLGHASIKETLDTYSHLMTADIDKMTQILNERLGTSLGTN